MNARPPLDFFANVRKGWGEDAPDWIIALATACTNSSQSKVAAQLGVSGAMVSGALYAKYTGDMGRLELLVRGALMGEMVRCPGWGMTITRSQCLEDQAMPFAASSPAETDVYRACRSGCLNFRPKGGQS